MLFIYFSSFFLLHTRILYLLPIFTFNFSLYFSSSPYYYHFIHSHSRTNHFFFLFLYFPPHIQPHSSHPCASSPWSSLFFSFSLNSTTHSSYPHTSSSWYSQVISLNFTKNLQYSLCPHPRISSPWSSQVISLIFYVCFQLSVYFVVSEMKVIWVISCIFNSNIDQKRFCARKSSSNLSAHFSSILYPSKRNFLRKHGLKYYQTLDFHFCSQKVFWLY